MTDISNRTYSQRRRVLAKSSPLPDVATIELVREQWVPKREISERMWWAVAEALNSDAEPSFNGLGIYPTALNELYTRVHRSLKRFAPRATRLPAVVEHARRWSIRVRDVEDSLLLAHIEESTVASFGGPRLQMPFIAYSAGPRDDLVRVGPQHEDPARLVELARRRVRRSKGWTLRQIAAAEQASDWRVVQSGLKAWSVLDSEL